MVQLLVVLFLLQKMMLSIGQVFSLGSGMKCGRIVLRSAYEDILALFKLKRKEQGQAPSNDFAPEHPEHCDHYFDHMSDLLQLVPHEEFLDPLAASMSLSTQPSAPPIPDSPSQVADSATTGAKAILLAYFEVHEQVYFKGIGLVDIVYVPWLEEVCNIHPSLVECQRNKTSKYAGWAFTALGGVLHFLETTKVIEMNEEACECLQMLWDEVQVFGFDLSWLAPQVEFALKMKEYVEKVRELNKLEEEKGILELRIQQLSMELVETEKEIESSKGDLAKVDSEMFLGYQMDPTAPNLTF